MPGRGTQVVALAALLLTALLATASAPWPGSPQALAAPSEHPVLDWNRHAMDALVNSPSAPTPGVGQPPQVAIQHLAMVQGAVYDAVNLIDGGHEPYLSGLPRASASASLSAAAATAAHDVLLGMRIIPALPKEVIDRLRRLRKESLAAAKAQDGAAAVAHGDEAGRAAAAAMLDARADDGRYGSFRFTEAFGLGQWRATSGVNDPNGWVARVQPFTLKSTSQFRTKGPHALTSDAYAREYQEVKDYGGNGTSTPSLRTPEQTDLALFYTVHPPEMFSRTFRALAVSQGLTLAEQARLFAMLNMAGADALINCWDDKAHWSFWRPITAIRAGADDGNALTDGDPAWTSLVPSPPYPDHPSGYNCVTAALMHTAEAYFDAKPLPFSVTALLGSPPAAVTREYTHFPDVVKDVIEARMLLGIHFRAPNAQGADLGRKVAHWVDRHYFQPVRR